MKCEYSWPVGLNWVDPLIHRFFFNKQVVQHNAIHGWLNLSLGNLGFWGRSVKLEADFLTGAGGGLAPLNSTPPLLLKCQLQSLKSNRFKRKEQQKFCLLDQRRLTFKKFCFGEEWHNHFEGIYIFHCHSHKHP